MPTLFRHDRMRIEAPLGAAEEAALEACFASPDDPSPAQSALATQVLIELRQGEGWLACACRGLDADPPPLMSPRLRDGQIHIWRHGSTDHAATCPWWMEESAPRDASVKAPLEEKPEWLLLGLEAEPAATSRPSAPAKESTALRAAPVSPLGSLLASTLERVGYNRLLPGDVVTARGRKAASARKDAYSAMECLYDDDVGHGLRWKDVTCTFLPGLPKHLTRLETLASSFPAGERPQGLFFGVVHEIHAVSRLETRLVWRDGKNERVATATVSGGLVRSWGEGDTEGPYWVIAQLATHRGEQRFQMTSAFAYPCLNRGVLLPVDSDLERQTAEMLLAQMTYWAKPDKLNAAVQLEKPLTDETPPTGESCRPGFVLWLPNKQRVLVETMRSGEQPGHNTKDRLHAQLRSLPGVVGVVEHRPGYDEPLAVEKRLTAMVGSVIRAQ